MMASPVDRVGNGPAHLEPAGYRVRQVESDVGEIAPGGAVDLNAGLLLQVIQQLGRQVVLQQVHLAAQQLEHPHGGITDPQELEHLAVCIPHKLQPARRRPGNKPEGSAAERLFMERMAGRNAGSRQDTDHEIAREQRVRPVEMKIQRVVIQHLDFPDQAQGTPVRRGIRGVENIPVGRGDILCR